VGAPRSKSAAPFLSDGIRDDQSFLANVFGHFTAIPAQVHAMPEVRSEQSGLTPDTPISNVEPLAERRIPQKLNLEEFGVTRFEYKTEIEPHLSPAQQMAQAFQMVRATTSIRELKPLKLTSSDSDTLLRESNPQSAPLLTPEKPAAPNAVQSVRLVFEPPPPPPVVRSVSMDIGDPESQVRVVIRERNGSLDVQFGSANERLREDLQIAGPLLLRELQRNNPATVTLNFGGSGSATDADRQSHSRSQLKKVLKPDAEFADVVETTYLSTPSTFIKSL
jgi:hypothetical protein